MKKNTLLKGSLVTSIVLILLMVGLDQWTKYAVMTTMEPGDTHILIDGLFNLTYVRNTGASFSMFEGFGIGFFAVITIAALAAIIYYYFHTHDMRIQLCLALIFAGAVGNFIDRIWLGYVRDFFSVFIFGWPFPVFNVADICISVGFVLLVITYLYDEWKEKKHGKENV